MKKEFIILKYFILCSFLTLSFLSCDDNDDPKDNSTINTHGATFILSEGKMGDNNASLSCYNPITGEFKADIFGGKLGDTATDMIIHGNKLYISVTNSNVVTVIDKYSLEKLVNIQLKTNDVTANTPRYLEFYQDKVYVTCNDGYVARIDTSELKVDAIIPVGRNPEGITSYKGKLYVANSGGMNYQNPDQTVSIIDILSFTEDQKINVGLNPYIIKSDDKGSLYLTYLGRFYDIPGGFQHINTETLEVTNLGDKPKQTFAFVGDLIYFYDVTYFEDRPLETSLGIYNALTGEFSNESFISDNTQIDGTPNGIGIKPETKEIYLSVAASTYGDPGKMYIFDKNGKLQKELNVGVNPNKVLFN